MVKNNSRRYLSVFLSFVMVMSAALYLPVSKASACNTEIEDTLSGIINGNEGYEKFLDDMEQGKGHTLSKHVGKDDEYLKNRLVEFNKSYNNSIQESTRIEINKSKENRERKSDIKNLVVSNEDVKKYLLYNRRIPQKNIEGNFVDGLLEYFCSIDYSKETHIGVSLE